MKNSKFIVVGAGISGLMAALKLAENNLSVSLFSLNPPDSIHHRAGLAAAMNPKETDDSAARHFEETITAGDFLAPQEMVLGMCETAPNLVALLARLGVPFNRTAEGNIDFRPSEGMKPFRAAMAGDSTGRHAVTALRGQVNRFAVKGTIEMMEGWDFLSLVMDTGFRCIGIVAMDVKSQEIKAYPAHAVILATGGVGALFGSAATSLNATGAAVSRVFQQGARLANPEFVQMNPACLEGHDKAHALAGALLPEGGRFWAMRDGKPWYFLEEKFPDWRNRVPYDLVLRTIDAARNKDPHHAVYMDVSHRPAEVLDQRFRSLRPFVKKQAGVDIAGAAVPVAPAYSYWMGGLWVDKEFKTSIPGLFACGQCQYQFHGAQALEGNILTGSLTSGLYAATHAVYYAATGQVDPARSMTPFDDAVMREHSLKKKILEMSGSENAHSLYGELTAAMRGALGSTRFNAQIKTGMAVMDELDARWHEIQIADTGTWVNQEAVFVRQLKDMIILAMAILTAALARDESRGAHTKPEFPGRDDARFLKTSIVQWTRHGAHVSYEDVACDLVKPGERNYS